jgi:hypothetical protein
MDLIMELGTFLTALQREELGTSSKALAPLIAKWKDSESKNITALVSSNIKKLKGTAPKGFKSAKSNQAVGNLMHKHFVDEFNKSAPSSVQITPCGGAGYPDNFLSVTRNKVTTNYCLEFKATSDWNPKDSNRRVLMSSTTKIRKKIAEKVIPTNPLHILITITYEKSSGRIEGVRLDFLDPTTKVNTRLEASTTHKLLHGAKHRYYEALI